MLKPAKHEVHRRNATVHAKSDPDATTSRKMRVSLSSSDLSSLEVTADAAAADEGRGESAAVVGRKRRKLLNTAIALANALMRIMFGLTNLISAIVFAFLVSIGDLLYIAYAFCKNLLNGIPLHAAPTEQMHVALKKIRAARVKLTEKKKIVKGQGGGGGDGVRLGKDEEESLLLLEKELCEAEKALCDAMLCNPDAAAILNAEKAAAAATGAAAAAAGATTTTTTTTTTTSGNASHIDATDISNISSIRTASTNDDPLVAALSADEITGRRRRSWWRWWQQDPFSDFRRVFGISHDTHMSVPSPIERNHILECVLESSRVKEEIRRRSAESNRSERSVRHDAEKMLNGMAAYTSLRIVRIVSWFLAKTLKLFYPMGVQDAEQVARLRTIARTKPLMLLPTHKSHIDYLIVGYMCLLQDLPLPHVVAGENLNIPIVGWILRKGGAFFIRRSFGGDGLYTAVFNEYCVQLLTHGYTIECFIEGTRSRSGKVLPPKTGFLSTITDAIHTNAIDDVYVVPINISYDRVVEHKSYISELTGSAKAPESLHTFLSSVTSLIFDTAAKRLCFGRIDVGIAEPLSVRSFLEQRLELLGDRPDTIKRVANHLGYRVLWGTNQVAKVLPTSLVGTILLTQYERGIHKQELVRRVQWLQQEVTVRGGEVVQQEGVTLADSISIVVDRVLTEQGGGDELVKRHKEVLLLNLYAPKERMELSLMRNQLMHVFQAEGIMACSLYMFEKNANHFPVRVRRQLLLDAFRWLSLLLASEFIYEPVPSATIAEQRFTRVLNKLVEYGVMQVDSIYDEETGQVEEVVSVHGAADRLETVVDGSKSSSGAVGVMSKGIGRGDDDDVGDAPYISASGSFRLGPQQNLTDIQSQKRDYLLHKARGNALKDEQAKQKKDVTASASAAAASTATFDDDDDNDNDDGVVGTLRDPTMSYLFLCSLVWPFIDSYWLAGLSLFWLLPDEVVEEKMLIKAAQSIGEQLYFSGQLDLYEAISKDCLTNALQVYITWKILRRLKIGHGKQQLTGIALTNEWKTEEKVKELVYRVGSYKKRSTAYRSRRYRASRGNTAHDIDDAVRFAKKVHLFGSVVVGANNDDVNDEKTSFHDAKDNKKTN